MSHMDFLWGFAGGLIPDALRIINNRYNPQLPDYLKTANFYIGTILLVLLGGGAAYLMKPDQVVDALAIGYSAPQIVSSILQQKANAIAPSAGPGPDDVNSRGGDFLQPKEVEQAKPSIRGWWGM